METRGKFIIIMTMMSFTSSDFYVYCTTCVYIYKSLYIYIYIWFVVNWNIGHLAKEDLNISASAYSKV